MKFIKLCTLFCFLFSLRAHEVRAEEDPTATIMASIIAAKVRGDDREVRRLKRQLYFAQDDCGKRALLVPDHLAKITSQGNVREIQCMRDPLTGQNKIKSLQFVTHFRLGVRPTLYDIEFDYEKLKMGESTDSHGVVGAKVSSFLPNSTEPLHVDVYKRFKNRKYIGQSREIAQMQPSEDGNIRMGTYMTHRRIPKETGLAILGQDAYITRKEQLRKTVGKQAGETFWFVRTQVRAHNRESHDELPKLSKQFGIGTHQVLSTLKKTFGLGSRVPFSRCCDSSYWDPSKGSRSSECQRYIDEGPFYCKQSEEIEVQRADLQGPASN